MATDVLWIAVLCLSLMGAALILWSARDGVAEAKRPPFKWDDLRKRKV
ncbi:hypothetical protein [Methylocystis sp. S23]